MMTSTIRKFGVGVASIALVAGVSVPAMAVEDPVPLNGGWDRVSSSRPNSDRIDTAIAVAQFNYTKPSEAQSVYIAGSTAMIDSAAAGQLTDGPILLVDENSRTLDVVKAEVERYTSATTVYAIGGTSVVSDSALKAVAGDKKTARLGGEDRYATSMSIAKRVLEVSPEKSKKLMVARADNPIDALAAGPLDFGPLVFVGPDGELTEDVKTWVKDKHVEDVIGLGGKSAVPDKALSEATVSVITDNPGKVDEEAIAARKDFEAARALYLGVNKFKNDFTVDTNSLAAATSRNPKLMNLARTDADQRFEGYKALAEEVQVRQNIADTAVSTLKGEISNAITDAKNAGNNTWTLFKGTSTADYEWGANGRVKKALTALYGTNVITAMESSGEPMQKFFILDSDEKVTGVNYGEIERTDAFKDQLKIDTKRIKVYFETHKDAVLNNAADEKHGISSSFGAGVQSQNLFTDTNTILALSNPVTNTGGNPVVLLQKDTELFLKTAQNNANTTKLAMDQAWAKVQAGQGYTRLGGTDRYATSAMISQYMRTDTGIPSKDGFRVYLANGETMADALVAGVFSSGPIILVDSAGNLTDTVKNELGYIGLYKKVKGDNVTYRDKGQYPTVFAIGGKNAVADGTASMAASYIKAGNDKVPSNDTELLITKQTYIKTDNSAAPGVAGTDGIVLTVDYQKDSSFSGDPTFEWQYSADGSTDWKSGTAFADGIPAGSQYLSKDTQMLTIKGAGDNDTTSNEGYYRLVITYMNGDGTVAKQVASNALKVTIGEA